MALPLYQVDAFTNQPFTGNPAAVCLLPHPAEPAWMQAVAGEMNLSETAFLCPEGDGWRLRWFTPKQEVDLCGHATLASAKVLFERQPGLRTNPLTFKTRSGDLSARWVDGRVELNFPALTYQPFACDEHAERALGFTPVGAARSGDYALYQAEHEDQIRQASPDFTLVAELPTSQVMITAQSKDAAFDFVSRFFAPRLGIDEDPVTGSAHCLLAPYWAEKMNKTALTAFQASARGGKLDLRLAGERVMISGDAVIVFEAKLFTPSP